MSMKNIMVTVEMSVSVPDETNVADITVEFPYASMKIKENGDKIQAVVMSHETINSVDFS